MAENLPNNRLSNWQLKLGYWYVSNKLKLKKALIIGLIGLNVMLFGYAIISALVIFIFQADSYNQIIASSSQQLIDYEYFHERNKPDELVLQSIDVIPTTGGRYDIVAKIINSNQKWYIPHISYQFISGANVLVEAKTFILPGDDKNLIGFGVEDFVRGEDITLNISEMSWRRILDYKDIEASRLKFDVHDVDFITSRQSGLSSRVPVSQSRFLVKNESAYNYWQVGFYVMLYSGPTLVGVNFTSVEEFRSGEEKLISMNWYETLPPISRTEVMPEVDILDESVYLSF